MKKKLLMVLCLVVCCFSFAFAGCSALDESDKTKLNQAYDKFASFVDNQAQTNQDLLNKIDELKAEEKITQDELLELFNGYYIDSLSYVNEDMIFRNEIKRYERNKLVDNTITKIGSYYNADLDWQTSAMASINNGEYTGVYEVVMYDENDEFSTIVTDLKTNETNEYGYNDYYPTEGNELTAVVLFLNTAESIKKGFFHSFIDSYEVINNSDSLKISMKELEDDKIQFVVDLINDNDKSFSTFEIVFDEGKLISFSTRILMNSEVYNGICELTVKTDIQYENFTFVPDTFKGEL